MSQRFDPITGKVVPVFFHYAIPSVVGMLAATSAGIIDGIFIGNYVGASALLSHMDRKGSMVALLPSVQGFGQFIGPNISASVLGAGLGYGTMFVVSGSMALVAMVLYIGIFAYMHRRKPLAAEAA